MTLAWLTAPLNTPLKRAAAIVLWPSSVWLAYLLIDRFGLCGFRTDLWLETQCLGERWWDSLLGAHDHRYTAMRWPTIALVASLALSYAYDVGLGRIVRWVRGAPREA